MKTQAPTRTRSTDHNHRATNTDRMGLGLAVAIALCVGAWPGWAEMIQILGIVVIVPLGMRLVLAGKPIHERAAWSVLPWAAAAAPLTYLAPTGSITAVILALPWFLFTVWLLVCAVHRFIAQPWPINDHFLTTAAMGFVAVGGTWFLIARTGTNPGGYSDAIVKLTGVHFHYAGFALPLVLAEIARRRPEWASLTALAGAGIVIGIPATALGLTIHGITELVGATFMGLVGLGVAALLGRLALETVGRPRGLLLVAATSLTAGMLLAITYTFAVRYNWNILPMERMVRTHGMLNGFGFGLMALIGFNLALENPAAKEHT